MPHFYGAASPQYPYPVMRSGRLLRPILILTLLALMAGSRTAQAQDGRSILLKTLHYYHSLHSYVGRANIDTLMFAQNGETLKHIGACSILEMQRPSKLYVSLQSPDGSRSIYSDGTTFSVYEASPDLYTTVPMAGKQTDILQMMRVYAGVSADFDALFFLVQTSLPKDLSDIQLKGTSTCNGHPVFVVTGTTHVAGSGKTLLPAYWSWFIDRSSFLLYRVETKTPNIVKSVMLGTELKPFVRDVKGTLLIRYTVSELKPDANISSSDFVFTPPKTASPRRTLQEFLKSLPKK